MRWCLLRTNAKYSGFRFVRCETVAEDQRFAGYETTTTAVTPLGVLVRQDVIAILAVQRVMTNANRQVMVAGIAPAGSIPQVVSPHKTCGDG
jgi:hypothetical protein